MLESQTKLGVQLDTAKFLRLWKDQLPEAWRKEALLEALDVSCLQIFSSLKLIDLGIICPAYKNNYLLQRLIKRFRKRVGIYA